MTSNSPQKKSIKYIVLSDLHLGESDSLFTPQGGGPAKLFSHFSACLADLVNVYGQEELPVMVLNGDILGLSFSSYADALAIMEQMVRAFTQEHKVCEQVAYLPGNHDQHIWQLAKESDYRRQLTERAGEGALPELTHVTSPLFEEGVRSEFLRAFIGPEIELDLRVLYPNFLIPPAHPEHPAVLIHHGHFTESLYCYVSKAMHALYPEIPLPADLETLAHENDGMIDFVFSNLGRSGKAGKYFEQLMATLSSKKLLERHQEELAKNLAAAVDYPYIPFEFIERKLSATLIANIAESIRSERYDAGSVCSEKTMKSLMHYLDHFCGPVLESADVVGSGLSFIWGHTHKPFEKTASTKKLDAVRIINGGGWVVPREPLPVMGASVVLIDESNDVQSLRIFNDGEAGGLMHFRMGEDASPHTPFAQQMTDYLYPEEATLHPLWASFRSQLTEEIKSRREKHE